MTDFETAARKATSDIYSYYGHGIIFTQEAVEKVTEIITKHYADLAETSGLLCELARLVKNHIDNHGGPITICSWCDNVNKILANSRIAALLKKG